MPYSSPPANTLKGHTPSVSEPSQPATVNAASQSVQDNTVGQPTAAAASLRRQVFDPMQVQLRQENGRWLLLAGEHVLKNFARRDTDAMLALHVIHSYRFNERWTLGEGDAAIEFWFSFGQPPRGRIPGQQTIPLHPEQLRVQQLGQEYWVTDGVYRYFRFRRPEDAEQAIAIIRQYRLTQVAVIGRPQPIMIYFLADSDPR